MPEDINPLVPKLVSWDLVIRGPILSSRDEARKQATKNFVEVVVSNLVSLKQRNILEDVFLLKYVGELRGRDIMEDVLSIDKDEEVDLAASGKKAEKWGLGKFMQEKDRVNRSFYFQLIIRINLNVRNKTETERCINEIRKAKQSLWGLLTGRTDDGYSDSQNVATVVPGTTAQLLAETLRPRSVVGEVEAAFKALTTG